MHCAGQLRPGVVWFGEQLPGEALDKAFAAAQACDLLLSVGTSGVVHPAAQVPELAWEAGAVVVHVNPQAQAGRREREYNLAGPAGEQLPALLAQAFGCG